VDWVRSCYRSEWRLPGIEGTVAGYYYFADDSPLYPGWSYLGSRIWHDGDGTPEPPYGELPNRAKWRNGSWAPQRPLAKIVGTPEMIAGETPIDPLTRAGVFGLPLLCWASAPVHAIGDGGGSAGGTADQVAGLWQIAAGGASADGTARQRAGWWEIAAGGASADGTAGQVADPWEIAAGGASADGTAGQVVSGGGTVTFAGCSGVPTTLYATISNTLGGCLDGLVIAVHHDGIGDYYGSTTACGGRTVAVELRDQTTTYQTLIHCDGAYTSLSDATYSCAPFSGSREWEFPTEIGDCGYFQGTVTVAETP
jgi:hypothetical protein